MRKKTILVAILASSVLASPALARDDSWYVEADFGGLWVPETDFDIGTTPDAARVRFQRGWEGAGVIGYDFGPFRLEAEGSYRWNKANRITANINIPGQTSLTGSNPFIGTITDNGVGPFVVDLQRSKVWGGMVNGLIDLGPDNGLQGYVGGGAGYMTVEHLISANRLGPGWLNDQSNGGFAWQGLAGVRYPISNNVDVGLKYRFLNVGNVDMVESSGRAVQSRWRSHSALLTLGYNFGSAPPPPPAPVIAPPPPPPPPPAPPPPPPPPPVCEKGPYIVFFDWDSADITPEAAAILDSAVAAYGNCANTRVMLAGHADRSGSTEYNVGLSQRRNASVTAYLGSRGIPTGSITGEGFGEGTNRVPTADGVRELQNRRVEITYGPGSGM